MAADPGPEPAAQGPVPPRDDAVERFLLSEAKGVGFCLLQAVLLVVLYVVSSIIIARLVPGAGEEFSFAIVRKRQLPSACLWSCATSTIGAIVGSRVIVALIRRARRKAARNPPG